MNLADLDSEFILSPLTVLFCIAAVCGLFALVTSMLNDDSLAAFAGILCLGAFGILAFNGAIDDYYESRTAAFTQQLRDDYGLETTTGLREIVVIAEKGGTVTMTEDERIVDLRVAVDNDFLKLYRVSDGELIQPMS